MRPYPDPYACLSPVLPDSVGVAESGPESPPDGPAPTELTTPLLDALQLRFGFAAAEAARTEMEDNHADAAARALQAAQDVRTALDGVDFLTRLQVSALLSGHGFLACCRQVGVEPGSLTLQRRRALDEQMASHFQRAVDAGGSLTPEHAAATLCRLLTRAG